MPRTISYLSPSSISVYRSNPTEFYLRYLVDDRPERVPQNAPMAIGSAFDAYVKSYLHNALFGAVDSKFELRTLFEAQVESQCRDLAWDHGRYAFDCYKDSGALSDLMLEMQRGIGEPRFEFSAQGA